MGTEGYRRQYGGKGGFWTEGSRSGQRERGGRGLPTCMLAVGDGENKALGRCVFVCESVSERANCWWGVEPDERSVPGFLGRGPFIYPGERASGQAHSTRSPPFPMAGTRRRRLRAGAEAGIVRLPTSGSPGPRLTSRWANTAPSRADRPAEKRLPRRPGPPRFQAFFCLGQGHKTQCQAIGLAP